MSHHFNPYASPQSDTSTSHLSWAHEHPEAIRRVKLGLAIVYYTICAVLLLAIAAPAYSMWFAGPDADLLLETNILFGIGILTAVVLLVGEILCISVPIESGARTFAIAAAAFRGLGLLMHGVSMIAPSDMHSFISIGLAIVSELVKYAGYACFVLFMQRFAQYIVRFDLASRGKWVLAIGGVACILTIGTWVVLTMTTAGASAPETSIPTLGGGILSLIALVMYANMVTHIRCAIEI